MRRIPLCTRCAHACMIGVVRTHTRTCPLTASRAAPLSMSTRPQTALKRSIDIARFELLQFAFERLSFRRRVLEEVLGRRWLLAG